MTPAVSEFLRVSAKLGADTRHVQGPGGNTSIKVGPDRMLVKASGFELARALDPKIFATVDYPAVKRALETSGDDPLAGTFDPAGPKPSIETTLHALMPHTVVLHTHSVPVVAVACRRKVEELLSDALGHLAWALVPYTRPGTPLAMAARAALERRADASILILANHGIVVGAPAAEAALALLEQAVGRLEGPSRSAAREPDRAALARLATEHGLVIPETDAVHALGLDAASTAIVTGGTLYPDHVVFLGSGVGLLADRRPGADRHLAPKLWLVPGTGALFEPGLPAAAHALAESLSSVVSRLAAPGDCRYLSSADEAAILGMEEEKYRQRLAGVG